VLDLAFPAVDPVPPAADLRFPVAADSPWMGSAGSSTGFPFLLFLFILLTEAVTSPLP
jgi:hypothetical protein